MEFSIGVPQPAVITNYVIEAAKHILVSIHTKIDTIGLS